MKTLTLFLFLFIMPLTLLSQDLYIPDNIYDKADEQTKSRKAFNRERWFYEQRMFPDNFIPIDAYQNSYEQREILRKRNGFYLNNLNNWVSIGPSCGYYFSYGNISSRITTIKFDPVNPNTVYLGAACGGVWKSTNGGMNWYPKTDYEVSLSSGALAIDPTNTNIIYYGTGEATYSGVSYYGRGLLKSTDGGNTWINYSSGLPSSSYSSRIVIRPGYPNQLLAAMGTGGLFKSTNAGVNWFLLVTGRCDDVVFDPTGNIAYIIGQGTGFRISTDGGTTFTQYTNTLGTRNHIAICKSNPAILYYSAYASSAITVYKSTNAGYNFSQVAVGFDFGGSQAWYDFYIHVNPFDPNYVFVGSIAMYRSTDGGNTFSNISSPNGIHVDQHNMDFHPTDQNTMFCTNDGGVWKSTDKGTTWTNLNASLTLTQFYRIAADPNNSAHVLGGTQDNGTQRTTGTLNWTAAYSGDGGEVCFHRPNSQYILGETQNNGVFRSTNGGTSWTSSTSGLTGTGAWIGPIITHPDSLGIYYTARQDVFKTTNFGINWFAISSGTPGTTIREMAICKSNPAVLYITASNVIYKSTDRGYTFFNVTSGTPSRTITSVNIHPDSAKVAIITFSGFGAGKIYKTTDGASSWFNMSGDLPDSPTNDGLIYYPGTSTSTYLVAMDIGVFMSNNWGNKWIELAQGLPNTVAMHLDYNLGSNKLRIGTHGRGVYEITGLVGIVNTNNNVPDKFSLEQNYPNPFNPSTMIKYFIKQDGLVNLKVSDIIGREVAVLVSAFQKAGTYEYQFSTSDFNLPSGIYFYTLSCGDFRDTKSMMLLK